MSIPRQDIDWQAYDAIPQRRGKDAAFAKSIGLTPENFAQYKRTRWRDEPTVEITPPPVTPTPNVPQKIALSSLCLTAGTQMRESLNLVTIAEYTAAMEDGSKFPPVIVFTDGATYWLGDGFQRVEAAKQVGHVEIEAEIRPGSLREAVLFSYGANAHHGERRTNADKRKSVLTLLKDTEWSQLSDRRIADVCGVTHPFVAEVRKSLVTVVTVTSDNQHEEPNTRQYVDNHGTTTTMHISNIGKRVTGEHKMQPEVQPSPVDQLDIITTETNGNHQSDDGGAVVEPHNNVVESQPSSCATCAEVRPLIDEALAQLRSMLLASKMSGYAGCEQALLTVRQLVTEKSAVQDA